jgi:hypothetical protein
MAEPAEIGLRIKAFLPVFVNPKFRELLRYLIALITRFAMRVNETTKTNTPRQRRANVEPDS